MSTEQNPHRPSEPAQPTVEIPAPTAAYPARPGLGEPAAPGDPATPGDPDTVSASASSTSSASSTGSATDEPSRRWRRSSPTPPDGDGDPGTDRGADRIDERPLVRTGPRSSTVVWGFVVVAVALGLLARAAGASIDAQLGAIVLLAVAGVLLVGTSATSAARRRRRQRAAR